MDILTENKSQKRNWQGRDAIGGNVNWLLLGKAIWQLLKNPKTELPHHAREIALGDYLPKSKNCISKRYFILFIAPLFIMAKKKKESVCLSRDE